MVHPRNIFFHSPNTNVILYINEGVHKITFNNTSDTLDLSNIHPGNTRISIYIEMKLINTGSDGRLVIKGAGSDKTVLVTDNFHNAISGFNVNRLTISDVHFTRNQVKTVQSTSNFMLILAGSYISRKSYSSRKRLD